MSAAIRMRPVIRRRHGKNSNETVIRDRERNFAEERPQGMAEIPLCPESLGFVKGHTGAPSLQDRSAGDTKLTPSVSEALTDLTRNPLTTNSDPHTEDDSTEDRCTDGLDDLNARCNSLSDISGDEDISYRIETASEGEEEDYDSDSITFLKQLVPCDERSTSGVGNEELLKEIQMLGEMQAELKKQQEAQILHQKRLDQSMQEHDKLLKELVHKEPSFKRRIIAVMAAAQFVRPIPPRLRDNARTQVSDRPLRTQRGQPPIPATPSPGHLPPKSQEEETSRAVSEHVYVQVEELYQNWHRLRFLSRKTRRSHYDDAEIYTEIGEDLPIYQNQTLNGENSEAQPFRVKTRSQHKRGRRGGSRIFAGLRNSRSLTRLDSLDSNGYCRLPQALTGQPLTHIPQSTPIETRFEWTIHNYQGCLAKERDQPGLWSESQPFYLYHCGYRCKLEAYLNGHGAASNKAMSLFLRVVRGDYDSQLTWPLALTVQVFILAQDGDHQSLHSTFTYANYKPESPTDVFGLVSFIPHEIMQEGGYCNKNCVTLRCRIRFNTFTRVQTAN